MDSVGSTSVRNSAAVTQRKIGLEAPALIDSLWIEAFREDKFTGRAHQGTGWIGFLCGGCRTNRDAECKGAKQRDDEARGHFMGSHIGLLIEFAGGLVSSGGKVSFRSDI